MQNTLKMIRTTSRSISSKIAVKNSAWKEAASLIIASPNSKHSGNGNTNDAVSDYDILFLKRGSKSAFYANAFVFPGGALDEADKDPRWLEVFRSADSYFPDNISKEFFYTCNKNEKYRTSLFPGDIDALSRGILPPEIAFRICAIRETFEEAGILLITKDVTTRRANPHNMHAESGTNLLNGEVQEWRKRVHNNAHEFITLCQKLKCVPDIWSLKDWSQWLTPLTKDIKPSRRYDTAFYTCCMKEPPMYSRHDPIEMSALEWASPETTIEKFSEGNVLIGQPQLIESLRLLNYTQLRDLNTYATNRCLEGMERWFPCFVRTSDCLVHLFPGDELYPENPDMVNGTNTMLEVDKTLNELYSSPNSNRFHIIFGDNLSVVCNISRFGQIQPVSRTIPISMETLHTKHKL